jgi:hypothetical protein
MEDSQHAADDGETQGDEQVKRPEDKRVNEDDLEGSPHGSITPSPELSKNPQIDSSAFPEPKQTVFYNKRENFASLFEKKGTRTYTKYHKKMSRKKRDPCPSSLLRRLEMYVGEVGANLVRGLSVRE